MAIWILILFASAGVQPEQVARYRSQEACELAIGDLSPVPAGFEARCIRTGFGVLSGSDAAPLVPRAAPAQPRMAPVVARKKHRHHRR